MIVLSQFPADLNSKMYEIIVRWFIMWIKAPFYARYAHYSLLQNAAKILELLPNALIKK